MFRSDWLKKTLSIRFLDQKNLKMSGRGKGGKAKARPMQLAV